MISTNINSNKIIVYVTYSYSGYVKSNVNQTRNELVTKKKKTKKKQKTKQSYGSFVASASAISKTFPVCRTSSEKRCDRTTD